MSERRIVVLRNWIIASVLAAGAFCLVFFLRHDFSFRGASDGCFVSGAFMLLCILFIFIVRTGVFDVLAYGMYRLGESFRPDGRKRYETAYDFKEARGERRRRSKPFLLPYLIIGGTMVLLAIAFLLAFDIPMWNAPHESVSAFSSSI